MVVDDFCPAGSQAEMFCVTTRKRIGRPGSKEIEAAGSGAAPMDIQGGQGPARHDPEHGRGHPPWAFTSRQDDGRRAGGPDDVKFQGRLSECQDHAGGGLDAQAMAAYVQAALSPRSMSKIIDRRKDEAARVREEINAGAGHRPQQKAFPPPWPT